MEGHIRITAIALALSLLALWLMLAEHLHPVAAVAVWLTVATIVIRYALGLFVAHARDEE